MNFSRFNPKNDPKQNTGHASVTVPSTPDASKGPAQADQKGNEAKPTVQAPGTPDAGNSAKSDGKGSQQDAKSSSQSTQHDATSGDKSGSEAMVSEGGHAAPGKTAHEVREPDAVTPAKTEPLKASIDGSTEGANSGLSAKSSS